MKQSYEIPRERPRQNLLAGPESSNYYSTLLSQINSSRKNPANVRKLIYEFARLNLEKELSGRHPPVRLSEKKASMRALEAAIAQVEAQYPPDDAPHHREYDRAVRQPSSVLVIEPEPERFRIANAHAVQPEHFAHFTAADEATIVPDAPGHANVDQASLHAQTDVGKAKAGAWFWFIIWPLLQFAGAPILGLSLVALTQARIDPQISQYLQTLVQTSRSMFSRPAPVSDKSQVARSINEPTQDSAPSPAVQVPGVPIPTVYGVYAASRGELYELEALPIKMPDARVFLSAEIAKPSRAVLPDGKIAFVVFRRDLVTSAPEKVAVRVIARVTRAMTFKAGKAIISPLEGQWRIRSNSYEFKVAPIGDTREMILIRSDNADFSLPAGRYALVINGQGYDFAVDGPITTAEQCLERIDAANGTVYSECRKP